MSDTCPITKRYGSYALTVVRVVLGIIFLMHGLQKVLGLFGGEGLQATVKMFTSMGMSVVIAYMVPLIELLGGAALILGLLTKLAALGIMIVMIGAVATVHWKNGFFMQNHGFEYNLALIGMCVSLILGGGGRCALENCCGCKKEA